MSENLTGKYLDGAGLSRVWEKVKSYSSNNYLPLGGGDISGDLRVDGILNASGTLNVDNKIVVGTPTSTLASDSVVTDPGELNSGIISYVPVYFTRGANCTTLTTDSIIVNNKTGFLKADGTVDDNSYLPLTGGELSGPLTLTGTDGNGTITSEGLISKFGLLVGTDGGDNTWEAVVSMNYEIGYFKGQSVFCSGSTESDVTMNMIPAYGQGLARMDISGPFITFNNLDNTNKGITFTPSLATFNIPTSATSITLSSAITQDAQATTKKYVDDKVSTAISSLNEVLKFKGSINSTSALPTSAELGWVYLVSEEGTYAGEACEVGDMIICTTASTTDPTWTIIQRNIPGVMSNDEIDSICTY